MAFLQCLHVYFFLGFAGVSVVVIVEAAVVEAAAARAAAFFLWRHSVVLDMGVAATIDGWDGSGSFLSFAWPVVSSGSLKT